MVFYVHFISGAEYVIEPLLELCSEKMFISTFDTFLSSKDFPKLLPGNFVVTIPACQTVIWGVPAGRSHNSLNESTNWKRDMKKSFILAVHETEHHWIGRRDEASKLVHAFEVVKRKRHRCVLTPRLPHFTTLVAIICTFYCVRKFPPAL